MAVRDPGQADTGQSLSPADQRWKEAAAELSPARSLARAEDRAKQVIGNVGLVGTLLGGLGLVASERLRAFGPARGIIVATVVVAFASVLLASWTLLLREDTNVRVNDLRAVEAWYGRQFDRARLTRVAGVLLLVAVFLAGIGAVVVLTGGQARRPVIELVAAGSGADRTAQATVRWGDLPVGQLVLTTLQGEAGGDGEVVLARGVATADDKGVASVAIGDTKVGDDSQVTVVSMSGSVSCRATLSLQAGTRGADQLACEES
jgi:hypothetical protein